MQAVFGFGSSNADLFCLDEGPDVPQKMVIWIGDKECWDEEGCLSDYTLDDDLWEIIRKYDMGEDCEGEYSLNGRFDEEKQEYIPRTPISQEDLKAALISEGFIYDADFEAFCNSFGSPG